MVQLEESLSASSRYGVRPGQGQSVIQVPWRRTLPFEGTRLEGRGKCRIGVCAGTKILDSLAC